MTAQRSSWAVPLLVVTLSAGLAARGLAAALLPPLTGAVVDPVVCEKFAGQSYALYLPSGYSAEKKWPVLYAFDARRQGRMVAELYRAAAERFGWIVVASNNARSDEAMAPNIEAMKAMWEDSQARYAIDPRRVYATGYSGGARAACVLAMVRAGEVAGVIGHGGGFPFQWPPSKDIAFAFLGLAGNRDFNFAELLSLDARLEELGREHHFMSFAGEHEWAPPAEAMLSLGWMEVLAMREGSAPRREALIAGLWADFEARAGALVASDDPVAAAREYAAMLRAFAGLASETLLATTRATLVALDTAPATARARQHQQSVEAEEAAYLERARARLEQILARGPHAFDPVLAARELEIARLTKRTREASSAYARQAAERSLATLFGQTSFYMPTAFAERQDFGRAAIAVEIATLLRPESVGAWFALAAARAQAHSASAAMAALRKAREKGRLEARWLEEDRRFDGLRERKDFQTLLGELRPRAEMP
jgi:predicted esterase